MAESKTVANFANSLPAHLQNAGNAGNENVSAGDLAIPRLNLLQSLSPQCIKAKAEYVEGAEPGLIHNSVTNELVKSLRVVNLYFDSGFVCFKKRAEGGGFEGRHATHQAAVDHLVSENKQVDSHDISQSADHYLMIIDENDQPVSPAMISMSSSKLAVSDAWNSQIQMKTQGAAPRFAAIWNLSSIDVTNRRGDAYANYSVTFDGFVSEALLAEAQKQYEGIAAKQAPQAKAA